MVPDWPAPSCRRDWSIDTAGPFRSKVCSLDSRPLVHGRVEQHVVGAAEAIVGDGSGATSECPTGKLAVGICLSIAGALETDLIIGLVKERVIHQNVECVLGIVIDDR